MARRAPQPRSSGPSRAAGVSLVELAVVLSILGLLGVVVGTGLGDAARMGDRSNARADAERARQAVRTFALRHHRLPCPDLSDFGDGAREGLAGSCPAGIQVGWLPYESLGLTRPDREQRLRYAVARAGGADLVVPATPGGTLEGSTPFRVALAAAARRPRGSDRPYLTGPGTAASPEDCAAVQSNPAFVLVAPVRDADGAGPAHPGFDGVNAGMASASRLCIAAPSRPADARYDDVVLAEGATALLGWLAAQTR